MNNQVENLYPLQQQRQLRMNAGYEVVCIQASRRLHLIALKLRHLVVTQRCFYDTVCLITRCIFCFTSQRMSDLLNTQRW